MSHVFYNRVCLFWSKNKLPIGDCRFEFIYEYDAIKLILKINSYASSADFVTGTQAFNSFTLRMNIMCLTRGKVPKRQIATIWKNGSAQTVETGPFFRSSLFAS
jgi:hypothetical protein